MDRKAANRFQIGEVGMNAFSGFSPSARSAAAVRVTGLYWRRAIHFRHLLICPSRLNPPRILAMLRSSAHRDMSVTTLAARSLILELFCMVAPACPDVMITLREASLPLMRTNASAAPCRARR